MWWSARHPCQAQTKRLRLHDRSDNYLDTHRPAPERLLERLAADGQMQIAFALSAAWQQGEVSL